MRKRWGQTNKKWIKCSTFSRLFSGLWWYVAVGYKSVESSVVWVYRVIVDLGNRQCSLLHSFFQYYFCDIFSLRCLTFCLRGCPNVGIDYVILYMETSAYKRLIAYETAHPVYLGGLFCLFAWNMSLLSIFLSEIVTLNLNYHLVGGQLSEVFHCFPSNPWLHFPLLSSVSFHLLFQWHVILCMDITLVKFSSVFAASSVAPDVFQLCEQSQMRWWPFIELIVYLELPIIISVSLYIIHIRDFGKLILSCLVLLFTTTHTLVLN